MMRKLLLMMAFVAVSFSAAAQKGNFNVKAGLGVANWLSDEGYEENCNYKLNWKVGAGFEFRVCKLIGIEPSVMLNSKGTKWEWEGVKFSRTANLLYLETPIMCNFHIGEKWSLGAGVYFATLVDDNNTKYNAYDSGFCFGGKYQFGNGYFLGLDSTLGATGATDLDDKWHNFTMGAIFGYRF